MSEKHTLSRRDFLRLTAAAATGAVVAACAPAAPAVVEKVVVQTVEIEKVVEKEVKPAGALKISMWTPASQQDTWGEKMYMMTDKFNQAHEGELYVEYVYTPTTAGTQMVEKLLTNIAAGTPPEAAYFDRFIGPSWAAEGSLTDLTELAAQVGIKEEDYFPFAWAEATWKGRLYTLPFDTDDRAVYYNKDHLEEAGFDSDESAFPTSIEEFDAMAEKLTIKEGPRFQRIGFIPWTGQGWIYSYGWTWDGKFYNPDTLEVTFNDPKIVAACEWMVSYADKYGMENVESFAQAFGGEAQNEMVANLVSMQYNGDWMISFYKRFGPDLNYGVVPMPWPEGGRAATWAGGWSWVIPAGAPNLDAGWEYISFMGSAEEVHWYCVETSHIPTQVKYAADPVYTEDPHHKVFMDLLPVANARPPLPVGNYLWNAQVEARDLIVHGQKTPQEAMDDITEEANKQMEKYL
jgi:multiple sugar transport system substrate-binding protein